MTTEPKAKGVDVLSVMLDDAAAAYSYRRHLDADRGRSAKEDSAEARAAVAELIEATRSYLNGEFRAYVESDGDYALRRTNEFMRVRDALKRIGGEG